ncbi:MAG: right-handed parallel beta-helix repeat-containing protein, partial [Acidimicrobiia bacterium]|nr:right-handed parallel beta-helix repeat-containing protein [Acidimicrobiia bacterium]
SFAGDFDGDGVETIGLHRNSTGRVYITNTPNGRAATPVVFGNQDDQILAGDWDGDGDATIAAYRPSTGMFYYRNSNSTGPGTGQLFVGRGVTVVSVSGTAGMAFDDGVFDPAPVPTPAPTPTPPSPTPTPPSGGGTVPGFTAPPDRQSVSAIDISGDDDVVIENVHVSNPGGDCIRVTNAARVTIRNSTIGPCGGDAVYLSDVDGASVTGNYITNTGNGVLVHRSDSVKVDGNAFVYAGRNFIQFDKVNGAGSSISNNRGQNHLGGSNAEDFISLYKSNGTSSSPIVIVGNHLRNGGPSGSGSGIMLGDGGGSHQYVADNVLVDPGQVGIGVASGTDITVRSNLIYSSSHHWSNVGIYVWNQYGSACDDITVEGNRVNWTAAGGYSNPWWGGGGCGDTTVRDNDWDASIGPGIF